MNTRHFLTASACLLALVSCSLPRQAERLAPMDAEAALADALGRAESASRGGLEGEAGRAAYARAVEDAAAAWLAMKGQPSRARPVMVKTGERAFRLSATWPKGLLFDELIPAAPLEERQLAKPVLREGVGATFVARWLHSAERKEKEPFLSEAGYLTPVTVTVDFRERGKAGREVLLRVHTVRSEQSAVIGGRRLPLAADFSAVGEHILSQSQKNRGKLGMSGLAAFKHSEKFMDKLGLIALEPPSRERIPLIFVHGLMSRPLTWHNAFNELGADPVLRENYQMFFFRYPTGVPVVYSSARFRSELARLHSELAEAGSHRAAGRMVLIGHSMGGLVSKMQMASSGDQLWVQVLGGKPADLGLSQKEYEAFRQYLEFNPNPHVERVIFVCTPHRGSTMAEGFIGAIGRRLVSLPTRILGTAFDLLQGDSLQNSHVKQLMKKGIPSSIDNLSPKSMFVKSSMQLPLKPGLHIHSIVGNKDGRPLIDPKCSDGVVPYTSAHLDGVESELVVRSDHSAHAKPEAIAEMRRILLLHLKTAPRS